MQAPCYVNLTGYVSAYPPCSVRTGDAPTRVPLPPPQYGAPSFSSKSKPYHSNSFQKRAPLYPEYEENVSVGPSSDSLYDNKVSKHAPQLHGTTLDSIINFTQSSIRHQPPFESFSPFICLV